MRGPYLRCFDVDDLAAFGLFIRASRLHQTRAGFVDECATCWALPIHQRKKKGGPCSGRLFESLSSDAANLPMPLL
jgi:hypothetical protein